MSPKKRILEKASRIKGEYRKQVSTAIIAAFGFLIALAWRDLITKLVNQFTKINLLEKYPYIAEVYSVIIITTLSVAGIIIVSRWATKKEELPQSE
mgnify:CR=1 FL=1